jgi:hypothetical protein
MLPVGRLQSLCRESDVRIGNWFAITIYFNLSQYKAYSGLDAVANQSKSLAYTGQSNQVFPTVEYYRLVYQYWDESLATLIYGC